MRAANSAREGATVSKVTGVSTYGAYTARMASASPRAAIRTFALVAQGEKSIGSILSCRKGRRCARSGQNRVPILPRACNRRPRPRLARSRLSIEPASSVLRRRMAAPCSPAGPAGTIPLIYMLQNRGFGTLGALHRKRFGQNPRSRFSRGDETIVARGGVNCQKLDFAAYFNIGRRTAARRTSASRPKRIASTRSGSSCFRSGLCCICTYVLRKQLDMRLGE